MGNYLRVGNNILVKTAMYFRLGIFFVPKVRDVFRSTDQSCAPTTYLTNHFFALSSFSVSVTGVANSVLNNVKRVIPNTADTDNKQDGGVAVRKAPSHSPPSPSLGNANNPNKADIPKTGSSLAPNVRIFYVYSCFHVQNEQILENTGHTEFTLN